MKMRKVVEMNVGALYVHLATPEYELRTSKLLSIVLFLGLLIPLSGCPGPKWPKCENDNHCKAKKKGNTLEKDLVCVFGQCLECGRDGDCDEGEACRDGRCEETCSGNSDCPNGLECRAGDCQKPRLKEGECRSAKDCDGEQVCNRDGKCIDKKTAQGNNSGGGDELVCESQGVIRFAYGLYDLSPEGREVLDTMAKCMRKNGGWNLSVAGHADERGTTMYNLDLGEKRALSIKEYLTRLGVEGKRIRTVSYGEEQPAELASTESGWAKNRRCELVVKK